MSEWNGMNCQDTMKMITPMASAGSPSQFCVSRSEWSPGPRPKFGSSSALKVTAIAAALSSSGMKKNTARTAR